MPQQPDTVGGFTPIPSHLILDDRVTSADLAVYVALASWLGAPQGIIPSHATIARRARLSVSTTQRSLGHLRELGYVQWQRRDRTEGGQTSSVYRILYPAIPVADDPDPTVGHTDRPSHGHARPVGHTDRGGRSQGPGGSVTLTDYLDLEDLDTEEGVTQAREHPPARELPPPPDDDDGGRPAPPTGPALLTSTEPSPPRVDTRRFLDRCLRHQDDIDPPPCGGCADAKRHAPVLERELVQAAERARSAEAQAAARARLQAVARCTLCNPEGYLPSGVVCTHDPTAADRTTRGAAAARAALAGAR